MTKKLIPTALAAAMLLAGCSLIPTYERPAAPVPTTFPGDPAQPAGPAAAAVPWEDFFTDARLNGLIRTALENNRDLRVSVLNIEQARAQFQVQRSSLFPAVGLTGSGSRSSPNPYQAFDSSVGSVSSQYRRQPGHHCLGDRLLLWPRPRAEGPGAGAIPGHRGIAQGRAGQPDCGGRHRLALRLIADDELLELTRQTLVTREESVRLLAEMRFDNGVSSELDFQAANSLAETARASYAQQQRTRMQDENALALLLGAPVPASATAGGAKGLDSVQPMPDVPARPALRPAGRAARHPRGRAGADCGQRQHRRGAGQLLPCASR